MNSKNANAMTGEQGVEDIEEIFTRLDDYIPTKNPIMSSTGVIGYRLNIDKIRHLHLINFDFNCPKTQD